MVSPAATMAPSHTAAIGSPPSVDNAAQWSFIETLSEGVYGVDPHGLCAFINTAAVRLLGYASAADLVGRHMHDTIHHTRPDGSPFPSAACPLLHTLSSGRPVTLDNELLWRRDGSSFIAEYSSFPIFGPDGVITGSLITFVDQSAAQSEPDASAATAITSMWGSAARRDAEEALRESEAKFRGMADSIPQLAWMTGPDGSINWYNRRWYDYTGATFEEMRGWGWKSVHHPDHVERVVEHINRTFTEGVAWEDTFPLRAADGSYRWFLSRAVPIHDNSVDGDREGRIIGWFGTNTDINDLREAEDRLQAAMQSAEEANRAKSDFIANMSHELRTPLSAIIGYSEMMLEEIADAGDDAGLSSDVRKIEGNARHLLGLINDVLDLSKVESGKMEVYAEDFAIEPMLQEVAATVGSLIAKKDNALELRIAPDVGAMHSDLTKVRQILLNLLSNAAKFTTGGTITLSVARHVDADGSVAVCFDVADSGIGMTDEEVARLFQRFQQADSSTTRRFGGTGLGLSLTKAFADMLGGHVSVESAAGQGSTFTLSVPASYVPAEVSLPDVDTDPDDAGRDLVLVIDDDADQRALMTRFLKREGFRVQVAGDGRSGLQLAHKLRPRAVLLDVMMPGVDGWSVLSQFKADPDLSATPVVMVTSVDQRSLASSLGASDYMLKPVNWDKLSRIMEPFRARGLAKVGCVLLIEDDAVTRMSMRETLEEAGWIVTEAANGERGLEGAKTRKPDVVLVDLNMPVMDGFTFLTELRTVPGCADTPVIILTGRDLSAEDRRLLRGASQILNRGDVTLSALVQRLHRLADPAEAAGQSSRQESR